MNELHTDTLSAFCDGELVDPERLRAALDDPHAREALVDFVLLRAGVDSVAPLPASLNALRPRAVTSRLSIAEWTAVAAALLVIGALTGALLSRMWTRDREAPPSPARVVRYVPGVDWHADVR
jgi:hypothetical protein